jgi:hypothetical protein
MDRRGKLEARLEAETCPGCGGQIAMMYHERGPGPVAGARWDGDAWVHDGCENVRLLDFFPSTREVFG